jgi:carbon storage regulator CsrA
MEEWMLVLTRREGESIRIGRDIVVTITEMSHLRGRPRCRVGIEAPEDVNIIRTELERKDGDSSDGYGSHKGK